MVAKQLTRETAALIRSGELRSWRPDRFLDRYRQLYLTAHVWNEVLKGWRGMPGEESWRTQRRQRSLHDLMDLWLKGDPVDLDEQLKPLVPWEEGVWEFRTNWPHPGARLFGFVADQNVFIAVGLRDRNFLGAGHSPEWQSAKKAALAEWHRLYPDADPLLCPPQLRDYVGLRSYWNDKPN